MMTKFSCNMMTKFSYAQMFFFSLDAAVQINETRLHKELFHGYNKHTHPRLPGNGPVTITFDFQLIRILDVVSFVFQFKV